MSVQLLDWNSARRLISKANPQLAQIIDELSPDSTHRFLHVKYPFGAMLDDNGQFFLPNPTNSSNANNSAPCLPFNDPAIPAEFKHGFDYNVGSNPACLVINNSLELFFNYDNRVIPYSVIPPGSLFGLWKVYDQDRTYYIETRAWGLSAGARSLFMLPKIGQATAHHKLIKKYQLRTPASAELLKHWQIFRELTHHNEFASPWQAEVVFFSHEWFQHQTDPAWNNFNFYMINKLLKASSFWRSQFTWKLLFGELQRLYGAKTPQYIVDTIAHLLTLSVGALPGFAPATNDALGPIKRLQSIYIEDYGLEYTPTIMQPAYFDYADPNSSPIYYSLQHPTALELAQKAHDGTTVLHDLELVSEIVNYYCEEISNGGLSTYNASLKYIADNVGFNYFHTKVPQNTPIRSCQELPEHDQRLLTPEYPSKSFPKVSTFLNGCIRIGTI